MKSTVTKLYDRKNVTVPEELTKWHVGKEEAAEKLAELAHSHATETHVDVVQDGDSVRLRCKEGSLAGRTVLLYPGLNLPFAAGAETAVLGRRVGECFTAQISGSEQSLVVEEILRRSPAGINDALVQAEGIEGVSTLEEYTRWFQAQTEDQKKEEARKNIAFFIQQEIAENSQYALDQEELDAWSGKRAKEEFEELLAMGEDPRIPKEGFELLSDEQAVETSKSASSPNSRRSWRARRCASSRAFPLPGRMCGKSLSKCSP